MQNEHQAKNLDQIFLIADINLSNISPHNPFEKWGHVPKIIQEALGEFTDEEIAAMQRLGLHPEEVVKKLLNGMNYKKSDAHYESLVTRCGK